MKIRNKQNDTDKEIGSKVEAHILNNQRDKNICVYENINMQRVLLRFPLPHKIMSYEKYG